VEQRASLSRKRMLPFTPENAAEFGGNTPPAGAGRDRAGGYGAGAGGYAGGAGAGGQGAGARRGRRGRRGGSDIDYDYSYVADAAGAKTTTKLGDVYADLFAQFGLSEAKADEPETKDTTAKATPEAKAAASTADAVLAAGDAAGAEGAA